MKKIFVLVMCSLTLSSCGMMMDVMSDVTASLLFGDSSVDEGNAMLYSASYVPTSSFSTMSVGTISDYSTSSSYSSASATGSTKPCSYCHGTGKVESTHSAPTFGLDSPTSWCDICKANKKNHSHMTCPSCKGKGFN